jgi:hypothetical protein
VRARAAPVRRVAQEVRTVGQAVENIAQDLESQLTKRTTELVQSIEDMVERARVDRFVDLALNAVELIDRNLYERTCDVRWWATDSALVQCASSRSIADSSHASQRLAVILGAYTVYLDLWLYREGKAQGFYRDAAGALVAFDVTPGYETYRGLGWYGVTMQPAATAAK